MKIVKILNNNTAVVIDDQQREKVVIGTGISFKKKVGDAINPASVSKTYHLSSDILNLRFQEIVVSISPDVLDIVDKIVDLARLSINRKISDSIYVSLSDHIHFSLNNYKQGITVTNSLLLDIQRFYSEEYTIGKRAIKIIEETTGIQFSDDEAGFIALHIVNAETENISSRKDIIKCTKIIDEVLTIVKNYFDVEIDEDSLTYFRFVNHLRYFSQRIVKHSIFKDDEKDRKLLDVLSKMYDQSYQCCLNIKSFIKVNYDTDIGNEELLYLTIHVQRAIYKE